MPTRKKPILIPTLYAPGPRYEQTHRAWGHLLTAEEIQSAGLSWDMDDLTETLPAFSFHDISGFVGTEQEQDPLSGFAATWGSFVVPGLTYLSDPVKAFGINLQLAATQVDLRYFVPLGQDPDGWTDKLEWPTGGWPLMVQTGGVLPEGVTKPERDTVYDGCYTGLQSLFSLHPNPQFAVALWILEHIRLRGLLPQTHIDFGWDSVQSYRLALGQDHRLRLYWRHQQVWGGRWRELPKLHDGSIQVNSWAGAGREGRVIVLEVWHVGHGIIASTDHFQSNIVYWRLPSSVPTTSQPWGMQPTVPSSPVQITTNTGNIGIQWFEYRSPCDMTGTDRPWVRSGAIRTPVHATEARPGDPDICAEGYPPAIVKWLRCERGAYPLPPPSTCPANDVSVYWYTNDDPAFTWLGDKRVVWVAYFTPSRLRYRFIPEVGNYYEPNLRAYDAEDPSWATAPIDYVSDQSPLLWRVTLGQKATVALSSYAPSEDADWTADDFKASKFAQEEEEAPVATLEIDAGRWKAANLLAEAQSRRLEVFGAWDTVEGPPADLAELVEGDLETFDVSQGPREIPQVTGNVTTILARVQDKPISGMLRSGEGELAWAYLEHILGALGLHPDQYQIPAGSVCAGIERLLPTGETDDIAILNVGQSDNPLWYPENDRSWRQLFDDVLLYTGDAGLWLVPYAPGDGTIRSIVTTGCRWCRRHRVSDPSALHYWANHMGPDGGGCRAYDIERTGSAAGIDYPCYTRGQLSTLDAGENLGYNIMRLERLSANVVDDYYNHVVVKGPSVRLGRARNQVAVELRDEPSIAGQLGYRYALGYERTAPVFQRDWITTQGIAGRVGLCLYRRYRALYDGASITIPYLPDASVGRTFSISGAEAEGMDGWICRVRSVEHDQDSRRTATERGTTTLIGLKIEEVS